MNYLLHLLAIFWLILSYQAMFLQYHNIECYRSYEPPLWECRNFSFNSGKLQVNSVQNLFCLYSCSKVGLKGLLKKNFLFLLLLVCGDIEKIPAQIIGIRLSIRKMCGFFRAAVLFIFEEQKLLPKDENDLKSYVDTSQGFIDMQNVFQGHFDIHVVELAKLRKNISRFQKLNKDWSRDHCEAKNEYYNTFSPTNWNSLSESEKSKHSLFCDGCPKNDCQLVAKFPSFSNSANKENPIHVAKTIKKKMKKMERHSLKVTMNEVSKGMNSAFESTFGISFDDSFQVHNKLEKQSKVSRRQLKTKHYRKNSPFLKKIKYKLALKIQKIMWGHFHPIK